MDPNGTEFSRPGTRFPRTGGDGPQGRVIGNGYCVFPPHRRGWTAAPRRKRARRHVSPAQAGMDLSSSLSVCVASCFPRTGGDGPYESRHE